MESLLWLAGHLTIAAVVLGIAAALGGLVGLGARVGLDPQQTPALRVVAWGLILTLGVAVSFALISIFY